MPDSAFKTELASLFLAEGELLEVPLNHRILLHDEKRVLWIEEGDLDIFVLAPKHSEIERVAAYRIISAEFLTGSFAFLHQFQKGQCIFSFPLNATDDYQVIGLANTPVKLRALSITGLHNYLLDHQLAKQELFKNMGLWVNALPSIFKKYRIHQFTHHLQIKSPTVLQIGETVAVPRFRYQDEHEAITWISIKRGSVHVLGIESINLLAGPTIYPISPLEWLQGTANNTHIEMFTEDYSSENYTKFWDGLLEFHGIIIKVAAYDISLQRQKEQKSSSQKKEKELEFLDVTLREMGTILAPQAITPEPPSKQPLIRACQLVGKAIQRSFVEPMSTKATNIEERIYEISVASAVPYRFVLLTPRWWQQDNGPLLGFLKNGHIKPISLLTTQPGHYLMVDPEKGITQKVDAQIAAKLTPKATMFYRAFPKKAKLVGQDIINFCIQGRVKDYWTILLIGLASILVSLLLPISNQLIFDEVIPFMDELSFVYIFAALIIMYASISLFAITREYTVLRVESYLSHDVEVALWERLFTLPTQFFRRYTIGNLIQRIFSIKEMRRIFSGQAVRVVINAVFSIVFLAAMLYYSPILTLVGISVVAAGLLVSIAGFLYSQKLELANQELKGQINGKVVQMIFGLSKIRTNGAENRIFASWAKDIIHSQRLRLRIGTASNIVRVTNSALELLKYLVIFITIIYLMQSHSNVGQAFAITIGSYLAFNAAFLSFSTGLADFSNILMEMVGVYPLWRRSKVILHEPPETSSEKVNPDILKGEVRIEHLSFRYDRLGSPIFTDISLNASPGEFIAIVGPSGCGKSTLMRLLIGFETPEQGAIYYDGKDLATLDLRAVRNQLGTILQNSMIIDGTIYDNITAGNLAVEAEVMNAAKMAGLTEDLKELPMGLQTPLTTGGLTLSGGQRQRVLLARAFLTKAAIMLWDEATNSLDNQSQDTVMRNLEKLDITRIVIAHRLSTIRNADRIYVMDQGKIIDKGTFKELASRPGMFTDMLALQTTQA